MLLPLLWILVAANPHALEQEPWQKEVDRIVEVELAWEMGLPTARSLAAKNLFSEATSPHGFQRVMWKERGLIPGPGQLGVDFNTETLQVSYGHPDLLLDSSWFEFYGRGQLFANQLLNDHAIDGKQHKERAINAGYLLAGAFFSRHIPLSSGLRGGPSGERYLQLQTRLELRKYFQYRKDTTSDAMVLPADNVSFEPTVSAVFSQGVRAGRFRRLRGILVKGEATAFYRPSQIAWGMPDDDGKLDGRNSAQVWSGRAKVEVEGGVGFSLGELFTLASSTKVISGLGEGLDDRNRFMLGGENRFVHSLPGAGWGEFLVDRFTSVHADVAFIFFEHVMFETGGDLVVFNDIRRSGDLDAMSPVLGVYGEMVGFITSDWLLRLRFAQAFGLPRRDLDEGLKIFISAEWRILPW